nr:protein FAM180A-like [Nerophis lumbriciformis]
MATNVLLLVWLFFGLCATLHPRSDLYPPTSHPKRFPRWLPAASLTHSVEDVKLLFEMLLSGMEIREPLHIHDAELASLRRARSLGSVCDNFVPKSLTEVSRLSARLDGLRRPLSIPDFQKTVLTLVHATQTAAGADGHESRVAWAATVARLFTALRKDLQI